MGGAEMKRKLEFMQHALLNSGTRSNVDAGAVVARQEASTQHMRTHRRSASLEQSSSDIGVKKTRSRRRMSVMVKGDALSTLSLASYSVPRSPVKAESSPASTHTVVAAEMQKRAFMHKAR